MYILHDLQLIDCEAGCLGLQLNRGKSELICGDSAGRDLPGYANGLCRVSIANATLLGSPIGGQVSIDDSILEKVKSLKVMRSRLTLLGKHDALCLLRHCFAIPKVLYILRSAPGFSSAHLGAYDEELRSTLSEVLNISLEDNCSWLQASLPVGYGGIGVRRATQLAPSAFLASAAGSSALISRILPDRFGVLCIHMWSKLCLYGVKAMTSHLPLPLWTSDRRPGMSLWFKSLMTLLDNAPDARSRARLLAVATN